MNRKGNLFLAFELAIVLVITAVAVLAPVIVPHDPYAVNLSQKLLPPGAEYPLGTDQLGRCVLSRLMYGARRSLGSALAALVAAVLLGSVMGLLAGFFGGVTDKIVLWLCDVMLTFPGTLLALVIVGMFGADLKNLVFAIAAVSWAGYARTIRSMVRTERSAPYVRLAVISGAGRLRILFRQIVPNIIMPALTLSVSSISGMIMRVAGMSFIGLGARLPAAEWGLMISSSREMLSSDPWLMLSATSAIFITSLGLNLIGDGLRDKYNPTGRTGA